MNLAINIIVALRYLIDFINLMILIRAVLSWMPSGLNSKFGSVLIMLTEPVVAPSRKLLYKFEFARNLPVDFSPWLAIMLLYLINMLLSFVIRVLLII